MTTLKTFTQKFSNDWSMNMVSLLTYNLLTTIFPLLLAILTAALYVLGSLSPQAFHEVVTKMSSALPSSMTGAINLNTLQKSLVHITGPLTLISLAGMVWCGSNLFSSMVTAGSSTFQSLLPSPFNIVLTIVGPLTSLFVLWVLFLLIYMVVPNTTVRFGGAWRGAMAAAILFAIFNLLFPLYFKLFLHGNSKFGAVAASLLVLVAWLWFFALITVIGAQINAVAMGIKPTRYDLPRTLVQEYEQEIASARQSPASPPSPSPSRKSPSLAHRASQR